VLETGVYVQLQAWVCFNDAIAAEVLTKFRSKVRLALFNGISAKHV